MPVAAEGAQGAGDVAGYLGEGGDRRACVPDDPPSLQPDRQRLCRNDEAGPVHLLDAQPQTDQAAIIYAKTKNIEVVKKLLGHAGLQATSAYLGVGEAEAFAVSKEFDL